MKGEIDSGMKRSEMVEKLKNRMNNVLRDWHTNEDADILLEFLENNGMKAPETRVYKHIPNPEPGENYFIEYWVNEWEDE